MVVWGFNRLKCILTRGFLETLGEILSILRFCILIPWEKKITLLSFQLCGVRYCKIPWLISTLQNHRLSLPRKSARKACSSWGPHGGMAVGNRLILTNLSPLFIKWSKPSVGRRLGSALPIYWSIKAVTVLASGLYSCLRPNITCKRSHSETVEGRSLSVPFTEVRVNSASGKIGLNLSPTN